MITTPAPFDLAGKLVHHVGEFGRAIGRRRSITSRIFASCDCVAVGRSHARSSLSNTHEAHRIALLMRQSGEEAASVAA